MRHLLVHIALALPLAAAAADTLDYTVRQGDTLIGISRTFLIQPTEWPQIARLNRLPDANLILPGQTLRLPLTLLHKVDAPAELRAVRGDVRVDGAAPVLPMRVGGGARIVTGVDSSALLVLADGTEVRLPPQTEAVLGEQTQYPMAEAFANALRVIQGGIEVLATKVRRAKPLEVTTPTAVIGVRGTRYRVAHEGASRTEVLEGLVAAAVPQVPETPVAAGQGARLLPGQKPHPVALEPAPNLSALPPLVESPLVRFALPGETLPLRAQVAADAKFEQVVRDVRAAAGQPLRFDGLPDGEWFLRVRRVGAQDLEGLDGVHAFRLHARPEPPAVLGPRGKAGVGAITLTWAQNVAAQGYRLQVARDAAFTQLLHEKAGLQGGAATVTLADPGAIYWRLASQDGRIGDGPWGETQALELRADPTPPRGGLSADGHSLELGWDAQPHARQEAQLAKDKDFKDLVANATLDEGNWAAPRPELPGTYYFRYRSVEADGYVSPWSSTLLIELPRDWSGLWWFVPVLLLGL